MKVSCNRSPSLPISCSSCTLRETTVIPPVTTVVHSERLLFVHLCLQLYTPKDYCYFTSAYSCTLRETTVIPPLPRVVHSERRLLFHLCLRLYTPRDYCYSTSAYSCTLRETTVRQPLEIHSRHVPCRSFARLP